jgi:hypothetical protein
MSIAKICSLISIYYCIAGFPRDSRAAFDFLGVGAEPLALGNALVASRSDIYAVYYNPANIYYNRQPLLALDYRSFFGLASLRQTNLLFNYPILAHPVSGCCQQLGNKIYQEILVMVGSSYVYRQKIGLGMSISLYSLNIAGYSSHLGTGINIGFSYPLSEQINMGVLITNLNQPKFSVIDERLPQIFTLGWSYTPNKKITLSYEWYRDVRYEQDFRAGVSVVCNDEFTLRLGLENSINTYSIGLGLKLIKVKIDYAVLLHTVLGISHVTGIRFSL